MTITKNFVLFPYFKPLNVNLFQKTVVPLFSSKVQRYKAILSEANVKTNRVKSTKWTHYKKTRNFRTSYKELIWYTNYRNIRIHTFGKRWSFKLGTFSLCASIITLLACEPAALLKRDSNRGLFLWILRNFWEHLFWNTSGSDYFSFC